MANLKKKTKALVDGIAEPVAIESQRAFCKRHKGLTPSALRYARLHNMIDVWQDGYTLVVLLTEKTLAYAPNKHKNRRVRKAVR